MIAKFDVCKAIGKDRATLDPETQNEVDKAILVIEAKINELVDYVNDLEAPGRRRLQ